MKRIIFFLILLSSCVGKKENTTSSVKEDNFVTISDDEFNNGSACDIKNIYAFFPHFTADTSSQDLEGEDWYQINLKADKNNWAFIESSMEDFKFLNRVTIKSERVKTKSGIKIGTTLKEVEDKHLTVIILDDWDDISFNIQNDKVDFRIDKKFKRNGEDFPTLVRKYPNAKITEFVISPACKR